VLVVGRRRMRRKALGRWSNLLGARGKEMLGGRGQSGRRMLCSRQLRPSISNPDSCLLTWNCALANELNHGDTLSSSRSTENLGRKHLEGGLEDKIRWMKLAQVSRMLPAKLCSCFLRCDGVAAVCRS
jgi:hypothetical protein